MPFGTLKPGLALRIRQLSHEVNATCTNELGIENQVVDVVAEGHATTSALVHKRFDGFTLRAAMQDDAAGIDAIQVAALKHLC